MIDATLGMFDILVDRITQTMIRLHAPTIYVRPRLVGIRVLDFEKAADVLRQARPAMAGLRKKLQ
jgi:NTE family protein